MKVENLYFDSDINTFSWNYNDQRIIIQEDSPFVSLRIDKEKNLICSMTRKDNKIIKITYYEYTGDKVFFADLQEGIVEVKNKKSVLQKKIENIRIIDYYPQNDLFIVGVGIGYPEKILGFSSETGNLKFETPAPKDSIFWYFGIREQKPLVSCLCSNDKAIEHRSGYWYEINPSSGILLKKCNAY